MKTYRLSLVEVDEEGRSQNPLFVRINTDTPLKDLWQLIDMLKTKMALRGDK